MSKEAISTERALKLALEAAYLAGWNASGEGYNAEYPFGDHARNPEEDAVWVKDRDNALQEALAQDVPETNFRNTALDKMAENARELGLDYEPAQETDQSVMYTYPSKPEPIPCGKPIGILMKRKGDEHMKLYPLAEQPEPDGVGGCAMCGAAYEDQVIPQPAQQEPVEYWTVADGWVSEQAEVPAAAWIYPEFWDHCKMVGCGTAYRLPGAGRQPLYSSPPAQQVAQAEETVKERTPQERRDAGEWHCPECFTFGHQHRRGCTAAHGIKEKNT